MTSFTRLGSTIWDWEPWTELEAPERMLWLALYTSAEAKRHVPGLWQGGIPSMADAARMRPDDVIYSLDRLLEVGLVEYDPKPRVLRLCSLPDAGEYPSNGKVIRSWWTRFSTVPECPVRDAHVQTILWILETGSKASGKSISDDHANAWRDTFARITIPSPRRRGVRRLADSDTGTQAQPSLFGPPVASVPSSNGIEPISHHDYPQAPCVVVGNSDSLRNQNKNRESDTVSDTVSDTNRIPDPGSRIPDLLFLDQERGLGGGHDSGRPVPSLVVTYTAAEVLEVLAAGNWDPSSTNTHHAALAAVIPTWLRMGIRLDDLRRLAEYSTFPTAGLRLSARFVVGCDIEIEVSKATKAVEWREVRIQASLREMS